MFAILFVTLYFSTMLQFNWRYFLIATLLFIVEVLIAVFVLDQFIRPYVGDFLVVILVYCFVKSFLNTPLLPTAIAVLVFSFAIEALQCLDIVNKIGLGHSSFAKTVIGTSFEWLDLIAYTLGIAFVMYVENSRFKAREG